MQVRKRRMQSALVSRNSRDITYHSIEMESSYLPPSLATDEGCSQLPESNMRGDSIDRLTGLQNRAIVLSHLFALISMVMVASWIGELGGLSWKEGASKQVFNWHSLMIVTSFCFMTVAALSFRYRFGSRRGQKIVHGMSWSVAMICAIVALVAVFKSHNDSVSGLIANMYSLHSWIGMTLIIMFILQFLFGAYAFVLPGMSPKTKSTVLLLHKYIGPFLYNMMAFTMLLGIQEKEGFIGCSYTVDTPDLFPIQHFGKIPVICRISHTLGIFLFFMALTTSFALHDFGKKAVQTNSSVSASESHVL